MINEIERQATSAFGYNPVALVECPHCGGTMQAIDAKKHIAAGHEIHGYGPGERPDDCPECLAEAEQESAR